MMRALTAHSTVSTNRQENYPQPGQITKQRLLELQGLIPDLSVGAKVRLDSKAGL